MGNEMAVHSTGERFHYNKLRTWLQVKIWLEEIFPRGTDVPLWRGKGVVAAWVPTQRMRIFFVITSCADAISGYVAGMGWQTQVSLWIVAATAGLLAWGRFRRRKFSFERDTHCGCSAMTDPAPQSRIIFRARKGERPEVLVKMK